MTTERRFVFPRRLKKVRFKNLVFIDNTYYNNLCQSFYHQLRAISIKSHSKQDLTATMKNLFGKWENEMPHHTFLEAIFDL